MHAVPALLQQPGYQVRRRGVVKDSPQQAPGNNDPVSRSPYCVLTPLPAHKKNQKKNVLSWNESKKVMDVESDDDDTYETRTNEKH